MNRTLLFFLTFFSTFVGAQQNPVPISTDALNSEFNAPNEFCELLIAREPKNLKISTMKLDNLATNGVIVRWYEADKVEFNDSDYRYRKYKLYFESFLECELFRKYYHFLFDPNSSDSSSLSGQHKFFVRNIHEAIHSSGNPEYVQLRELIHMNKDVFGGIVYDERNQYHLKLFDYNPTYRPYNPLNDDILIADFVFKIENDEVVQTEFVMIEEKINQIKSRRRKQNKIVPPPPPPPPLKRN